MSDKRVYQMSDKRSKWIKESASLLVKHGAWPEEESLEYAEALADSYYEEEYTPYEAVMEDASYAG